MTFNFVKDIEYAKNLLEMSDEDICKMFQISRMTYYRWINSKTIPSRENLENIYSCLYDKKIRINKLKEEMYKGQEIEDKRILFHGAKNYIEGDITVEKSEPKKDFGKGFYLGETLLQSASFVSNYRTSSVYVLECKIKDLKVKEYGVTHEWMILISYFRGKIDEYKDSKYIKKLLDDLKNVDLVIAPIADNTMYEILDDFSGGEITDLQCLNALSANWLGKQYVFLNDKAIKKSLTIIDKLYLCEKEKNDYKTRKEENTKIGKQKVKLAKREYAGKGKYIEELLQ